MKKIPLIILSLAFFSSTQTFSSDGCDIESGNGAGAGNSYGSFQLQQQLTKAEKDLIRETAEQRIAELREEAAHLDARQAAIEAHNEKLRTTAKTVKYLNRAVPILKYIGWGLKGCSYILIGSGVAVGFAGASDHTKQVASVLTAIGGGLAIASDGVFYAFNRCSDALKEGKPSNRE